MEKQDRGQERKTEGTGRGASNQGEAKHVSSSQGSGESTTRRLAGPRNNVYIFG